MATASSPEAAATSSRSALPLWPIKMMRLASSPLTHGDTLLVSLATLLRCMDRARSRSSSDNSVRICGLRNVDVHERLQHLNGRNRDDRGQHLLLEPCEIDLGHPFR